jgi:hypothetical protein
MGKLFCHASPSDRDHLTTRLIIVPEVVLFGFAFDHLTEKSDQLLVACPVAHRRFDIEFQMAAQTWTQFSFAGKTQLVADPCPILAITERMIGLVVQRDSKCPWRTGGDLWEPS